MEATAVDPRWQPKAQAVQDGTSGTASPRSVSFSSRQQDASSLSIVFSASWVRLATPIGEGAFSRVFEGVYRNPETLEESVVAVKILKKNMLKRRSDCLRFIKEAKIMTKISHKNIAACYGIGKYDDDDAHNPGSLFIVQELIKGGNLLHKVYKQMLNRAKCVYTSQEALAWMIDVAHGMQYLHSITENKPMIIHRDLKLENIMLSPEINGVSAKLVDFGLHKVIDDRIKKVVKRVISEANLGGRLGLGARARHGEENDDGEVEDELEAALAEQRAMVVASSVKPGVGPAAQSPLGASPVAKVRQSPLRVTSRMQIEASGPSMSATPEDVDEEEEAIASAQAEAEAAHKQAVAAAIGQAPPNNRSPLGLKVSDGPPEEITNPALAKVRAPPKKQSSMQKLMAKMKEIKLRVTGKEGAAGTAGTSAGTSNLSKPTVKFAEPEREPVDPAAAAHAEKMARNEALLNRLIAQQSTAQDGKSSAMDDLGLETSTKRAVRAPPRRAVTWINEIRYNLTEAVGSWAYMAPEVVLGQPYNEKVDVFSFGVILFEVLNRKLMLVDEIKNDPRKDAQAYAERVARGFRPEIPRRWPEDLTELITACWAQDPHMRPNFVAVVDALKEIEAHQSVGRLDAQYWSRGNAFI
uniref:Protein kinase domain-containing protein n=1 Tax=Chlamydomonas leiostraca TaxID=1034604 RepID=A0A7S0RF21_9CHLO|mmetsp:Transcript_20445/g.51806  ORF Transcript_20445/g.51806 Transcript_20445/m.51806 type:complete len:639 (+) Transcript_20445:145-2061(+)